MMKKNIGIIVGLVAAVAVIYFTAPKYTKEAFKHWFANIDDYKLFYNDTLSVDTTSVIPSAIHIPSDQESLAFLDNSKTVAYLVIQNDSIIFERYYDEHNPNTLSGSFSMAKSVVSLAIGKAIAQGHIKGVTQKVKDFFPEWSTSYKGYDMTIEDLLTMSAGIHWREMYVNPYNITTSAYYGDNLYDLCNKMEMETQPGTRWEYQSICTQMLGMILTKSTGMSVADYVDEMIWKPMEMQSYALWSRDKKGGYNKAFCCLNATARDFGKLGLLVLHDGKYHNKPLIDSAYIYQATHPASALTYKGKRLSHYGYQFWILNRDGMQIPYFCGILGQFIFVIPEKNAVIVRLGKGIGISVDTYGHYKDAYRYVDIGMKMLR